MIFDRICQRLILNSSSNRLTNSTIWRYFAVIQPERSTPTKKQNGGVRYLWMLTNNKEIK